MCLLPLQGFASVEAGRAFNENDSQSHFTDSCSENCSAIPEITTSNSVVESETTECSLDDEFHSTVTVLSAEHHKCDFGLVAKVLVPKPSYGIANPSRAPPYA
jgi:hypothetical protein